MSALALVQLIWLLVGMAAGAAIALIAVERFRPRVTVVQVAPEDIARGILAGGGIRVAAPTVYVDWSIIHQVVEAEGYQLIAKHAAGPAQRQ